MQASSNRNFYKTLFAIDKLWKPVCLGLPALAGGISTYMTLSNLSSMFSDPLRSSLDYVNDASEEIKAKFGDAFRDGTSTFRKEISTTILSIGATGLIVLISQITVRVIGAYAHAYLKHYVGRPKLAMEYQFETWGTRFAKILTTPYRAALAAIYGEEKKEEIPRPIFKEEIQKQIAQIEKATQNTHKHGGYFSNLLLYGPPGTGKTMISKILARETGMNYFMMSGGDLAQFIKRGEHVSELNQLFNRAKNGSKPTIIFIDEAEGLAKDREKMTMERVELLNSLLNHTGDPSKKFMLILATNRVADLDDAVLSRMDSQIYVGPPAAPERIQILRMYINKFFPNEAFFTDEFVASLNERIEGFTGRDIFKLCNSISVAQTSRDDNQVTTELVESTLEQFLINKARVQEHILKARPSHIPAG